MAAINVADVAVVIVIVVVGELKGPLPSRRRQGLGVAPGPAQEEGGGRG